MPRLMLNQMRSYLSDSLILALLLTPVFVATSSAQQFDVAGEKQLVELIDQARASEGLPPLAVDERLTRGRAQAHAAHGAGADALASVWR